MGICAIFDANDGCLNGVQSYKKYICYIKSVLYTIIYDVFYFNRQDSWYHGGFHYKKLESYFTSSLPSILRVTNDDDNNNKDNDKRAKVL